MPPSKKAPPRPGPGELRCEFRLSGASLPIVTCDAYPAARGEAAPGRFELPPALCYAHARQVEVQGTRRGHAFDLGDLGELLGGMLGGLFGDERPVASSGRRRRPAATPAPSSRMSPALARVVLRFGPVEQLTVEKVKARKRELARDYHPDAQIAAGAAAATAAMQEINAAAEVLLAELGR